MACDSQTLVNQATCLECGLAPGVQWPVVISLLSQIAGVPSDPQSLMAGASCLLCNLSPGMQMPVIISLLCQLAVPTPVQGDISPDSTDGNLIIDWQNPTPTTTEVWKSTNGGAFARIASVAAGTTQFTDTTAMNNGDLFTYKLRAVLGAQASDFTATFSALKNFNASASVTVLFPDVVFYVGQFVVNNNNALLSVSFPVLHDITSSLSCGNCLNLTTLNFPALRTVGGGSGIDMFGNPLVSINFNSLVTSNGQAAFNSSSLTSVSLPKLTTTGSFDIANNTHIASFSVPSLVTGGNLNLDNITPLTTASFPALTSCSDLLLNGSSSLTSFSAPNLQTIGGVTNMSGTALTSLSLPSLTSTGDMWTINSTPITSISLPAFTTFGFNIDWSLNTSLVSVDMGGAFFFDGMSVLLNGCALNAASVNAILHLGVLSNTTTSTYNLSGVTNAAPTGQGIADKATLIAMGNTVTTN